MVCLVARRRARRESVSKDRSFLCFIWSGIAEHATDFYRNKERMIVTFASPGLQIFGTCLGGFAVYILGMVIEDFSDQRLRIPE